jgi:hypothetical protein
VESQLAEATASVNALTGEKQRLEGRLEEAEDLLARVQGERDELKGGRGRWAGGFPRPRQSSERGCDR